MFVPYILVGRSRELLLAMIEFSPSFGFNTVGIMSNHGVLIYVVFIGMGSLIEDVAGSWARVDAILASHDRRG